MDDYFKFENKDLDFPVYKKNPHFSKKAWIILFILMFIGLLLSISSKIYLTLLSCLVILFKMGCKGNISKTKSKRCYFSSRTIWRIYSICSNYR